MMMSDIGSLEQAILNSPEDDDLRLRLASLLERQGDPRGQFIRVQIELARLPDHDSRRPELKRHEMDMLLRFGKRWSRSELLSRGSSDYESPSFGPRFGDDDVWSFRRGFMEVGTIGVRTFLRSGELILKQIPVIGLTIHGFYRPEELRWFNEAPALRESYDSMLGESDTVEPFAACPHLQQVRELHLSCHMVGDPGARVLTSSPYLSGLRSLRLGLGDQSYRIAETLAGNASLAQLSALEITYDDDLSYSGELGNQGVEKLAGSINLRGLHKLGLRRGRIGPSGLGALLASPVSRNLQVLEISGNPLGIDGVRALTASKALASVRSLNLSGDAGADSEDAAAVGSFQIGARGVVELSASRQCSGLMNLDLSWNEIGDDGAAAIASSPYLSGLRSLDIGMNEIGASGAQLLSRSPYVTGLFALDLGYNKVGDAGVHALSNSPAISRLSVLNLSSNGITDEGVVDLANAIHTTQLTKLNLSNNEITCSGLRRFVVSPTAGNLTEFSLGGHSIGNPDDDMIAAIASSPQMDKLSILDLGFPDMTEVGARLLTSSPYLKSLVLLKAVVHDKPRVAAILRRHFGRRVDIGEYER